MWVFCAGMRRAGSTLQYQVASHLVEGAGRGKRLPWSEPDEFAELRRGHAGSDEWLVLKSHDCTPEMAAEVAAGGARVLCTVRDLRDVIASQSLMLGVDCESVWSSGFLDECVAQHAAWAALPGTYLARYEDIVSDPAGHVTGIADHLEVPVTTEEAAAIAAEYSLERQRARIESADAASLERVPAPGGELRFDPHTLLHHNHLNSGRPGAWAGILSDDEVRRVEAAYSEWLREHGYAIG